MIRVLIASGLRLPREAMAAVLSGIPGVQVVAQVATGTAVAPCAVRTGPNVAVLDADLPGLDGISVAVRLRSAPSDCRVVLVTPPNRPDLLGRALTAPVDGLLSRSAPLEALTDTVNRVAHGERVLEPHAVAEALHTPDNPLGAGEVGILRLASYGHTPEEIGAALHLSAGTIRNKLAAINRKIGARNRIESIRIATTRGWI
ncbi:response regulator [Nocardia sp. CC227C]|uniref:response regulator transcription factor n=1 Tax=Nocardia sp. CC227C TaxID=3044562 RepID=UPI00278C7ADD|nr:response regulator transcription factor [Nocardia sp. CC227C]